MWLDMTPEIESKTVQAITETTFKQDLVLGINCD